MKQVMQKQEAMQQRILEAIEKRKQDDTRRSLEKGDNVCLHLKRELLKMKPVNHGTEPRYLNFLHKIKPIIT